MRISSLSLAGMDRVSPGPAVTRNDCHGWGRGLHATPWWSDDARGCTRSDAALPMRDEVATENQRFSVSLDSGRKGVRHRGNAR